MPEPTKGVPSGAPLPYRTPGPEPKSQWLTDDQACGTSLIYALLLLTTGGAVLGLTGWVVWTLIGFV